MELRKKIFTEFLWLLFALVITCILGWLFFEVTFICIATTIHFHNTNLILIPYQILLPLFVLITFLIYFIKESRHSFSHTISNWILILAGITFIVSLTWYLKAFSQIYPGEWTIYPPSSNLEAGNFAELSGDPLSGLLLKVLVAIQITIIAMLLYAAYRWGTHRGVQRNVN